MKKQVSFVTNHYHSEVLEFLFELYNEDHYYITWYYDIDWYNNDEKYKQIYGDKLVTKKINELDENRNYNPDDLYFIDSHVGIHAKKWDTIIIHSQDDLTEVTNKNYKYITLTPLLSQNYMIPVTKPDYNYTRAIEKRNFNKYALHTCLIGSFEYKNIDLSILEEILDNNIFVHLFSCNGNNNDLQTFYDKYKNKIALHLHKSTVEILEIINNLNIELVLFLPPPNRNIYSGAINFAYNNTIPLLTLPQIAETYKFKGHIEVSMDGNKINLSNIYKFMHNPQPFLLNLMEFREINYQRNKKILFQNYPD